MDKPLIAIDAMGGAGVAVSVPACVQFLTEHTDAYVLLIGDESEINPALHSVKPAILQRIEIEHTVEKVEDDDTVLVALKNKKNASMRLAIQAVKIQRASACVSGGNTGALMAISCAALKTIPGINRPAITSQLPTYHDEKGVRMLDLGANVGSSANTLFQFALMGSLAATALDKIESPRVALLNIGQESHKGHQVIQEAGKLLQASKVLNYVGFIEPNMIFSDVVDVIVCDGFVGNIALKSMEGTARLFKHMMKSTFMSSFYGKIIACLSAPIMRKLGHSMSPSRRNGASLIGLNGIVVKSHGDANIKGFANAIKNAYDEIQFTIPQRIADKVTALILK